MSIAHVLRHRPPAERWSESHALPQGMDDEARVGSDEEKLGWGEGGEVAPLSLSLFICGNENADLPS